MRAVCIKNPGYKASLEVGRAYQVVGRLCSMLHIVDESGEAYYYPKSWFRMS
jgi:hypothetical protein